MKFKEWLRINEGAPSAAGASATSGPKLMYSRYRVNPPPYIGVGGGQVEPTHAKVAGAFKDTIARSIRGHAYSHHGGYPPYIGTWNMEDKWKQMTANGNSGSWEATIEMSKWNIAPDTDDEEILPMAIQQITSGENAEQAKGYDWNRAEITHREQRGDELFVQISAPRRLL